MISVQESRSNAAVDSVLRPSSVVIIGASPRPTGFASAPLKNLSRHSYEGTIYAVNPNHQEIDGVRCYGALTDLPDTPDTAVVVVGAQQVPDVLADCADHGIKSATVVAGGFAELGELGERLESEIKELCASTSLRIVGPNTAGLLNVLDSYIPRAAVNHPDQLTPGGLAVLTQSGALCNTLLNRVLARGLGLSYAVATGSQWDLDLWDFVEYFMADARTSAVLMIVEGLNDPERCLHAVEKSVAARKPIIMLKLGKSEEGRQAVQTHSGALAGAAEVQLSILEQSGVILVDDLDELWEVGQLFDRWGDRHPIQPPRRLVVGAYSGGDGAIAVDAAVEAGLECPTLSPGTLAELSSTFTLATPANPFDYTGEVIGRPELIGPATAALLKDPACELFLLAGPVWSSSFADWVLRPALEEVQRHPDRLSAVSLWSAGRFTDAAEEVVREFGLPLFDGSQRAVRAIGKFVAWCDELQWMNSAGLTMAPLTGVNRTSPVTEETCDYWAARGILSEAGVRFNRAELATTAEEAVGLAETLGYPISLKLSFKEVVHKAAADAVRLYLTNSQAVSHSARQLIESYPNAALVVEEFVPSIVMAFVGGHRDEEFGPVVVAGLGGMYAESYQDVVRVRCPAEMPGILRALLSTNFGRLLEQRSDWLDDLAKMMFEISHWFATKDSIQSFDINPVLYSYDRKGIAVDARVVRDRAAPVDDY